MRGHAAGRAGRREEGPATLFTGSTISPCTHPVYLYVMFVTLWSGSEILSAIIWGHIPRVVSPTSRSICKDHRPKRGANCPGRRSNRIEAVKLELNIEVDKARRLWTHNRERRGWRQSLADSGRALPSGLAGFRHSTASQVMGQLLPDAWIPQPRWALPRALACWLKAGMRQESSSPAQVGCYGCVQPWNSSEFLSSGKSFLEEALWGIWLLWTQPTGNSSFNLLLRLMQNVIYIVREVYNLSLKKYKVPGTWKTA